MARRRIHDPGHPATSEFNTGRLAVGTGPYRHAAYAHNERLEVVRNQTYWGRAEPWERVIFRYIPQGGSRVAQEFCRRRDRKEIGDDSRGEQQQRRGRPFESPRTRA